MTISKLPSALLRSVRSYAGQLTTIAKRLAPNHLKDNIATSAKEVKPGQVRVTITARGADAEAQEFGSGIHGRKKRKYPIVPKKGKYLAFKWDMNLVGATYLPDGRILLPKVMHPGIKKYRGRGYIRPAVTEWKKDLKKKLSPELRQAILGDVNRMFKTGRK